ncbi:hypothetical protein CMT48_07670 [Elizabethkingia anophelis]|nr:hypothetical protein [Elizabethkingia anophelis]
MIDGVKLLCNINPTDWTNNKNLSFRSWIDTSTGEISHNNKHANIKGLHLSIIEGDKETFCNLRGSLPVYYTGGNTNNIDYSFTDFISTCIELNTDLQIQSKEAVLRGFEFGVNIELPFDISVVYEAVKSCRMHVCGINEIDGKRNGLRFDFQQYRIKIYDKGQQQTGKKSNIMRFEIAVKKMVYVKHLNIKTLSDLQNSVVWIGLSKLLIKTWQDIVFVDKSLNYKLMTNHEQKKYLYYFDAHYWANLNRKQYHIAKNHLNKLQFIYEGKQNYKKIICDLITDKLQLLATVLHSENGYNLTIPEAIENTPGNEEKLQHLKNQKRERFNHLDKGLKPGIKVPLILKENDSKKIPEFEVKEMKKNKPKKCHCINCKKIIEGKKVGTKFCSTKCKNNYHGKKRTQANQKTRMIELKYLNKILPKLHKMDLTILIVYKSDILHYSDTLKQCEIDTTRYWIRQIKKVTVTDHKTSIELTTIRAKTLIRAVTKLNKITIPAKKPQYPE